MTKIYDSPCRGENGIDCLDRRIGCHGECEKYAAFVEKGKKRQEEATIAQAVSGMFYDSKVRYAKKKRQHRK